MTEREATPAEKALAIEAYVAAVHHVGRGGRLRVAEPSPPGQVVVRVTLGIEDVHAIMERLAARPPRPPPPQMPLPPSCLEPGRPALLLLGPATTGDRRLLGAVCAACVAVVLVQRALGHSLSAGQYLATVGLLLVVGVADRQRWL